MIKVLCIGLAAAASAAISLAPAAADLSMMPIYRTSPGAAQATLAVASVRGFPYLQACTGGDETEGCLGDARTDRTALLHGSAGGMLHTGATRPAAGSSGAAAAAERPGDSP
jgi:hypothetical protein